MEINRNTEKYAKVIKSKEKTEEGKGKRTN